MRTALIVLRSLEDLRVPKVYPYTYIFDGKRILYYVEIWNSAN